MFISSFPDGICRHAQTQGRSQLLSDSQDSLTVSGAQMSCLIVRELASNEGSGFEMRDIHLERAQLPSWKGLALVFSFRETTADANTEEGGTIHLCGLVDIGNRKAPRIHEKRRHIAKLQVDCWCCNNKVGSEKLPSHFRVMLVDTGLSLELADRAALIRNTTHLASQEVGNSPSLQTCRNPLFHSGVF
jgi:hypothetical protein